MGSYPNPAELQVDRFADQQGNDAELEFIALP
jgi:hypothetical protein